MHCLMQPELILLQPHMPAKWLMFSGGGVKQCYFADQLGHAAQQRSLLNTLRTLCFIEAFGVQSKLETLSKLECHQKRCDIFARNCSSSSALQSKISGQNRQCRQYDGKQWQIWIELPSIYRFSHL